MAQAGFAQVVPNDGSRSQDAIASRSARGRLFVVSELYYPETTSTGYFLTGIAEALTQGFDVHAVCSQATYRKRGTVAPRQEVRNGVSIWRARSARLNKDIIPFRIANVLSFSIAVFLRLATQLHPNDLILVVTNPPILPFVAIAAARLRGARVVLLVHDVYPDVLVAAGMIRPTSWICRLGSWVNRALYARVEQIIVLGRDMRRLVQRNVPIARRRPAVISNWGDTKHIHPDAAAGQFSRRQYGLEEKFVVQMMGNLGRTHDLDTMLDVAVQLRNHQQVRFVCIGQGAQVRDLQRRIEESGLTNVLVLPPCTSDLLNASLNACDIALIAFRTGMAGISVPSRLYNILAAGKPVIAATDSASDLARIVRNNRVGFVIPPQSAADLARAIDTALRNPRRLLDCGQRARAVAEARYSAAHVTGQYLELFRELARVRPV